MHSQKLTSTLPTGHKCSVAAEMQSLASFVNRHLTPAVYKFMTETQNVRPA